MKTMRKLPGYRRSPHGMEWKILKKLPKAFLYSAIVIGIFVLVAHWLPPEGTAEEVYKHLELVRIMGVAILITVWTGIFTVGFGAFVVYLMKGPSYVADALPLVDADKPGKE